MGELLDLYTHNELLLTD